MKQVKHLPCQERLSAVDLSQALVTSPLIPAPSASSPPLLSLRHPGNRPPVSPLLPQQSTVFARMRQVLTWTLTGICSTAALWGVGTAIAHGETFQVSEVMFVGNDRAGDVQLRHLADIRSGVHLFNADLTKAVRGIERHPWVKKASARRRFPGAIEVQVQEYEPKMLLAIEDLWMVDGEGHVFKRANSNLLDFPVLSGIEATLFQDHPNVARAIITDAIKVQEAVEADDQLAHSDLSEIHFDGRTGYALILRSGTQVVLGFADPSPALDRLSRMREQGLDILTPQRIDLDAGSVAIATPLH
jgi:cell division septal protein FtsQ